MGAKLQNRVRISPVTKPAYMIIGVNIHDADTFHQYAEGAVPLLSQLGATVISAANDIECLQGDWTPDRLVVLQFQSLATARAFYDSPEYAPYKAMRESCSDSDIVLVEGNVNEQTASEAAHRSAHYLLGFSDQISASWVREYQAKVPQIVAKYGAVEPCSGAQFEVLHGRIDRQSMILLQFPSEAACRGFWQDPDYQRIKKLREGNTLSEHVAFPGGFSVV
jgi:uncharacterized protein (DUF1330 family)